MTKHLEADSLFEPTRLGALELPNRLVMAPMTRNRAAADGTPTALMAEYYAQRAGAGLIIAEAAIPSPEGITYPNVAGIFDDAHTRGWREVTGAVAAAGGRMFLQIEHGGRVGHPDNNGGRVPIAPSPIALPEGIHTPNGHRAAPVPREMDENDLRRVRADFTAASRRALTAGFAGVEIHAANGYLLHQFLADGTNRRTDAYGGSIANRIRLTLEVVRAVAGTIGSDRVGIRLSPGTAVNGITESDTEELYPALFDALEPLGLAYAHIVFADPDQQLFHELRRRWSAPIIANPNLGWGVPLPADGGRAAGERLLASGADLVSLGRAFLANPDLVERLRIGAPLNPVRDKGMMYTGGSEGYTDYPILIQARS